MTRALATIAATALIALGAAQSAEARSRVYLGFNLGVPLYYGPPAYYYPPPAYYYPPPAYYYPPPPRVTYYVPPPPAPATNCRTFQGDASIDASGQPFYGTACLQSDGRWYIVR